MPDTLLVILAVVFVLGIAINIHEFGHFIVAKMFGMRVEAYSFFGLGPRIWGFKVGHTDYRISAIPLGAYVKLYGDEATASLEGGESEGEKVPDSELYELRPRWQKFLVMVGGPFMNIMLALAIPFGGALMNGVPTMPSPVVASVKAGGAAETAGIKPGDRIVAFEGIENPTWDRIRNDSIVLAEKQVPITVERNGQRINLNITPTKTEIKGNTLGSLDFEPTEMVVMIPQPDSPAAQAGIQKGDKAIAINGTTVSSTDKFKELVQANKDAPMTVTIVRNNETKEVPVQAKVGEDGRAIIGAQISNQSLDKEKASVGQAASFAVNANLEIIRMTGKVFGQMFSGERSPKDAGLAGPIGIVQLIAQIVREAGFAGLVSILALISLNLGVFNLLPIPLLDGGQIMVLGIEKVLSWFGKTLSMAIKEKIQLVGLAVILLLMVTTIFFDISRLFGN
ncbi:MAG: Zinc metalloprotease [Acidobacteria bacterium]|jgi:regulator of sigma E protease|nr:Zinc metalloprotease [Acidobacteriota bacterium]